MKPLLSVFLLLLLACLLGGTQVVRFGLKQVAMSRMQVRLKQEKNLLAFPEASLSTAEWENDHEFRLHGHWYDVDKVTGAPGHHTYYCLDDVLEARLEQQANAWASYQFGRPGSQQGKLVKAMIDWQQVLFFYPPVPIRCLQHGVLPIPVSHYAGCWKFAAPAQIINPPPEVC